MEADVNWIHARGSKTALHFTNPGEDVDFRTTLSWLATLRARAGVTLSPTLIYVTGGLAVGGVRNDATHLFRGFTIRNHQTRTGWAAGGGIEHFIANPHMTVKAELLYVDFGSETVEVVNAGLTYTGRFKNNAIIGRVGVNLKW